MSPVYFLWLKAIAISNSTSQSHLWLADSGFHSARHVGQVKINDPGNIGTFKCQGVKSEAKKTGQVRCWKEMQFFVPVAAALNFGSMMYIVLLFF